MKMFKHLKFFLVLSVPFLLKYVFLFVFIDFGLFNLEDIAEDAFFLLMIVSLLYSSLIKKQFFIDGVYLVYIFYLILETTSYMAVSSNFSSSYMYLLLESNQEELKEFSSSYLNFSIVLFIVSICISFFVIRKKQFKVSNKYQSAIGIFGVLTVVVILKFTGLIESNAYHNIVRGGYGYFELQNSIKFNSQITKADLTIESDNEVLVFVLGESTARRHMQLYGYKRETTPLLNSLKDSMYVYNNVISTDVFTLKSVPKILTSLDVDFDKGTFINMIEIFNIAGYNTYWLSNQRPISYHDNAISKIASASNEFKFYNHIIDKHTLVLDEILFPDYDRILSKSGKKVIFVRLIGTHFDYNKRYPDSYNKFALNKDKVSREDQIRNHYDNAVFYNDYIVHALIKKLETVNKKSALIYLSDHGENIYDEGTEFFGRSEEILTPSMFEIPFFLWTSKAFTYPNDFVYKPTRKFMADHTFESICHVFGVLHASSDVKRSIFSKSFIERERRVIEKFNFDSYFLVKKLE